MKEKDKNPIAAVAFGVLGGILLGSTIVFLPLILFPGVAITSASCAVGGGTAIYTAAHAIKGMVDGYRSGYNGYMK